MDDARRVRSVVVTTTIDLTAAPASTRTAYLRLRLSHRLVKPNTINLDGIFAVLPASWTDAGPCVADSSHPPAPARPRCGRPVTVQGIIPADGQLRAALRRAYHADGTRVRHGCPTCRARPSYAGFVNFNAGTLGRSMVGVACSQGVIIGDGSGRGRQCTPRMGTLGRR